MMEGVRFVTKGVGMGLLCIIPIVFMVFLSLILVVIYG
jgi:hypothetical protein